MSSFQLIISLCLGILFLDSVLGCTTSLTGATWKFTWGVDEEIPGVETVDLCSEYCREDASCRGFTWLTIGVVSYCYKFKSLDGIRACDGCSSGTFPETFAGACAGSVDDIIDEDTTENVEGCAQFCLDTLGCNAYTWYNSSAELANSCFLYESCIEELPCSSCVTGRINCISNPQCFQYRILDEETRSDRIEISDIHNSYCDREGREDTSLRWKGEGYYRFMEPSGTMMPESSLGEYHCGTHYSGWLNGSHPMEIGLEVEMKACFLNGNTECYYKANIKVTNCSTYYVYYLEEVPACYARYCTAKQK